MAPILNKPTITLAPLQLKPIFIPSHQINVSRTCILHFLNIFTVLEKLALAADNFTQPVCKVDTPAEKENKKI